MKKLDWALWAVENTPFYVFPLRPNSKKPLKPGAMYDATRDPAKIEAWWADCPDANPGYAYFMSGHGILDLDVKDAVNNGVDSWRLLCQEHGEAPTLALRTNSSGRHLVYADPAGYLPTASAVWPGIDTRGVGGLGVGVGATIDGNAYAVEESAPIAPLPAWIRDHFGKTYSERQDEVRKASASVEADTDLALIRAGEYLDAQFAAEGGWGENDPADTYSIAARLHDFGVSERAACDMLLGYVGNSEGPWLKTTVHNAYAYAQNDFGCDRPIGGAEAFQEALDAVWESLQPPKLWRTMREMKAQQPIDFYDANRMLPRYAGTGTIFGLSGAGKSSVMLLWAHELARQGVRIAYLCGEGDVVVGAQMRALANRHAFPEMDELRIYDAPMLKTLTWDQVAKDLDEWGAQIVFVDTLATITAGLDEFERIGALFTKQGDLGKLARRLGALVLVIDHTGYKGEHERGDSAKGDNTDVRIAVNANVDVTMMRSPPSHVEVHARKIKGARPGHRVFYALEEDSLEGTAVPVQCTETEWLFYLKDKKDPKDAINLDGVLGLLRNRQVNDEAGAWNSITLARALFESAEAKMETESYHRMAARAATMLERRQTEFAACSDLKDGVIRWYVR